MKCPVCEEKLDNAVQKCPKCGFADLRTEFINQNELEMWQTYVVYPCRFAYQTAMAQSKEFERKLQEELSAIKKAQNEVHESGDATGTEMPNFKRLVLDKNGRWLTTGNLSYKGFYECEWVSYTKCEISNLVLNIIDNSVTIDFFVKKTFDRHGDQATTITGFKWKLKDDYGIVVADGSWSNNNMQISDVTKGSFSIKGFDPSIKYVLELVNF